MGLQAAAALLSLVSTSAAYALKEPVPAVVLESFPTTVTSLLSTTATAVATPAQTVVINSDTKYGNSSAPVSSFACGAPLAASGNTTLGSVLQYPYVAGFSGLEENGSSVCGACFVLEWAGNYVGVQVVDSAEALLGAERVVLSEEAYAWLTLNETTSPVVVGSVLDGPFACHLLAT